MTRYYRQPSRKTSGGLRRLVKATIAGVGVSLVFSILAAVALAVFCSLVDSTFVDDYLLYIMVAVNITGIFCGSAFAAHQTKSYGLVMGMAIGFLYVSISLVVGVFVNQEVLAWLPVANKLLAALASGALGGLVGVNL